MEYKRNIKVAYSKCTLFGVLFGSVASTNENAVVRASVKVIIYT